MWIPPFLHLPRLTSVAVVQEWLVELYVSEPGGQAVSLAVAARAGADGPTAYLGSIYLPAEETCFHRFSSPDAETLCHALDRAGVQYERVLEAVALQ
jgi:hypothetical protein